jgi:hypothetical protein
MLDTLQYNMLQNACENKKKSAGKGMKLIIYYINN